MVQKHHFILLQFQLQFTDWMGISKPLSLELWIRCLQVVQTLIFHLRFLPPLNPKLQQATCLSSCPILFIIFFSSKRQGKGSPNEDSLLTVLCDYTSNHMENRRCQHLPQPNGQPGEAPAGARSSECESPLLSGTTSLISLTQTEELFELIASSQSRRLDDQRASIGDRLGITIAQNNTGHFCEACNPQELSDDFFNMVIKYQVKAY